MNPAPLASAAAAVVVVAVVVAVLVSRASRRRWHTQLDAARADVEVLAARLDDLTASRSHPAPGHEPVPEPHEFVITSLSGPGSELQAVPLAGTQLTAGRFASVAAGESLVRVLSFGYGVRRALSAENRHRIRFEMRREVKRARRRRRRDLKEAKRHLRHVTTGSEEDAA
jgi:hypothetical protein